MIDNQQREQERKKKQKEEHDEKEFLWVSRPSALAWLVDLPEHCVSLQSTDGFMKRPLPAT